MPRNISFQLTTRQVEERTKTVTRRMGWERLKIGEVLTAVEKGMGLKKGEHVRRLCQIRVVSFRKEPLNAITIEECRLEGFPGVRPEEFVLMFSKHNRCSTDATVNRIEFEYI